MLALVLVLAVQCGPVVDAVPGAPAQSWPELGPTVRGVLLSSVGGTGVMGTGGVAAGSPVPPRVFTFTFTSTATPWAVYFDVDAGEGVNNLARWQLPTPNGSAIFDTVAMLAPGDPVTERWGITARAAQLVELDVNGGKGASPGIHFVATGVRVLDGTPRFPPQLDAVLDDLWARYAACTEERLAARVDAARAGHARAHAGRLGGVVIPEHRMQQVRATWDDARSQVRMVFTTEVSAGTLYWFTDPVRCRPNAPCRQPPLRAVPSTWTVATSQAWTIDAAGALRAVAFAPPR